MNAIPPKFVFSICAILVLVIVLLVGREYQQTNSVESDLQNPQTSIPTKAPLSTETQESQRVSAKYGPEQSSISGRSKSIEESIEEIQLSNSSFVNTLETLSLTVAEDPNALYMTYRLLKICFDRPHVRRNMSLEEYMTYLQIDHTPELEYLSRLDVQCSGLVPDRYSQGLSLDEMLSTAAEKGVHSARLDLLVGRVMDDPEYFEKGHLRDYSDDIRGIVATEDHDLIFRFASGLLYAADRQTASSLMLAICGDNGLECPTFPLVKALACDRTGVCNSNDSIDQFVQNGIDANTLEDVRRRAHNMRDIADDYGWWEALEPEL